MYCVEMDVEMYVEIDGRGDLISSALLHFACRPACCGIFFRLFIFIGYSNTNSDLFVCKQQTTVHVYCTDRTLGR